MEKNSSRRTTVREDSIEEYELSKETCLVYWRGIIPVYFGFLIIDRLLSIIFDSNYIGIVHVLPYSPIWFQIFTSAALVTGLAWLLYFFPKYFAPYWLKTLCIGVMIIMMCGLGIPIEAPFIEQHGTTFWTFFPILWALTIVTIIGPFVLAIWARTAKREIAVIIGLAVIFGIIHWGFYNPMFPEFSWVGEDTSWSLSGWNMSIAIMSGLGTVAMIVMGIVHLHILRAPKRKG